MKLLVMLALIALTSTPALADCIGTGNFKTCYDDSGNTYSVSKYGNTTNVNGYNSSTGSSWSQQSNKVGNTTFTTGTSADGNNWDSTTQKIGSGSITYGTDSNGDSFNSYCDAYGNCY